MTDYITIEHANLQSMTSVSPDRIRLPYKASGDVLYCAELMLAEAAPENDYPDTDDGAQLFTADCLRLLSDSTITAFLVLVPCSKRISATVTVKVVSPSGHSLQRCFVVRDSGGIVAEIVTDFFAAGAPGLCETYRDYFDRQHRAFLRRAILNGGFGLDPIFCDFFTTFSRLVQKGNSAKAVAAALDRI